MAASIVALTCPVCGAPFSPSSDRCDFCGSILALKTDHPRIDPKLLNKAVIDEHIAAYRRTLRTDPNDETAHYGLGVAYFNLGLVEDSVSELTQAARLMPENPNIQAQLAVVLRDAAKQGDAEAKRQMNYRIAMALRLDPNHLEALLLQADVYEDDGDLSSSVDYLEKAYVLDHERTHDKLGAALNALLDKHTREEDWRSLPEVWTKLRSFDRQAAMKSVTKFLDDNRKLIPARSFKDSKAASVGSNVFLIIGTIVATLVVGFIAFAIFISIFGPDSWIPTAVFLVWLASLVAVPIWAVKRKGGKNKMTPKYFDRDALIQGHYEYTDTKPAALEVIKLKIEAKAKADEAIRRSAELEERKIALNQKWNAKSSGKR